MKPKQFGVRRQRRRFGVRRTEPGVALCLPPLSRGATALAIFVLTLGYNSIHAQTLSRDQWGGMPVTVLHQNGNWVIQGKKHTVTLNDRTLALTVGTGHAIWSTLASNRRDMLLKNGVEEFELGVAQAKTMNIVPYDVGFKTGVKISLGDWVHNAIKLDLNPFGSLR